MRGMSDAEERTGEVDTEGGSRVQKGGKLHERLGAAGGPGVEEEEREEEKGEKKEEKQEGSLESDEEAVAGDQARRSSIGLSEGRHLVGDRPPAGPRAARRLSKDPALTMLKLDMPRIPLSQSAPGFSDYQPESDPTSPPPPLYLQNDTPESAQDGAGAGAHQGAQRAVNAALIASAEGKQPGRSAAESWKV